MEGFLLILSPLILLFVAFFVAKALIRLVTGKSTGQWANDREAKKLDGQALVAMQRHRATVAAAERYVNKYGTDGLL